MSRPYGFRRAYASVSVIAVTGLLAGCSQPASYATVDLSGSYANGAQRPVTQGSGLPVYQSTQVYTTPGLPVAPPAYGSAPVGYAAAPVNSYIDVPANQVASLAPVYGGGFSAPARQSTPTFGMLDQGPVLTDETVLRSDGFIDIGPYGGTQTAALAPGAGSFQSLPLAPAIPDYAPAPQSYGYADPAPVFEAPAFEPLPLALPSIEAAPLAAPAQVEPVLAAPLPAPAFEPQAFAAAPSIEVEALPAPAPFEAPAVGFDYAAIEPPALPQYRPSETLIEEAPRYADPVRAFEQIEAERAIPAPQPVALPNALDLPAASEPVLAAPLPAPDGSGILRPVASDEYVRPYEPLRPGFFPPYEFGPAAPALSEAPAPVIGPDYAAFEPVDEPFASFEPVAEASTFAPAPLEQASAATFAEPALPTYTVQPGDTLYGIAREHGVSPHAIAQTNDIAMGGTIFPGDTLSVPGDVQVTGPDTLGDAPIVVLQTAEATVERATTSTYTHDANGQSVEMVDVAELARMFRDREQDAGLGLPLISAEAGQAMRGRVDLSPTEVISNPAPAPMIVTEAPAPAMQAPRSAPQAYVPAPMPVMQAPARYQWPVQGEVYRLAQGQIEIAAPFGAPVKAAASGRVVHVENGPRGYLVVIEHDDGWRSLTLGLSGASVRVGERVMQGMPLGMTGMDRIRLELRDGDARVTEALGVLRS